MAATTAKELIEGQIKPERENVLKQIYSFQSFLNKSREDFSNQYNTLKTEVAILEERNRLIGLADIAIADGKREAFEELENFVNNPTQSELVSAANAEILRVKAFYLIGTRIKGVHIYAPGPFNIGDKSVDEQISTKDLISALQNNPEWQIRAKAAELLGRRQEKGVLEALLQAMHRDQRLDVVKVALDSFESITGFSSNDVFGYEAAEEWWSNNKQEIDKKLKEQ